MSEPTIEELIDSLMVPSHQRAELVPHLIGRCHDLEWVTNPEYITLHQYEGATVYRHTSVTLHKTEAVQLVATLLRFIGGADSHARSIAKRKRGGSL